MKHTSKRLQALVLVLAMCVSFLQIPSFAAEQQEQHNYSEIKNVAVDEKGNYTVTYACTLEDCNETITTKPVAAPTPVITTPATCEVAEEKTYTIPVPTEYNGSQTTNYTVKVTGKALGHVEGKDNTNIVNATCAEAGHFLKDSTVCTRCGKVLKDGIYTVIPATGNHTYDEKTGKCTVCGQPKPSNPTHTHTESDPVVTVTKEATCTETGSRTITTYCTDVAYHGTIPYVVSMRTETIPAKGHTEKTEDVKVIKPATCTEAGIKEVKVTCSTCQKELGTKNVEIPATGHVYSANNYTFENDTATCSKDGTKDKVYRCVACKEALKRETVESKKADHETKASAPVKENVVEATCTKAGSYDSVTYCANCKEVISREHVTVPQAKHNYVKALEWDDKDTITGNDKLTCKVIEKCAICGEKKATYSEPAKVVEDTTKAVAQKFDCQPGSKTFVATFEYLDENNKKVTLTDTKTVAYYKNDKHDHDLGTPIRDDDSIVKATCVKDGSYNLVKICKVCGEKEVVATLPIDATGKHTAAAAKKENVVAATTKKGGSYDLVVRCADCGEIISSTHKTTAKIVVKASKINSVKNYKGKKAKVTVKKTSSIIGYQIQYGTKKNFKGAKHVNTRKTSKYLTKLAKNKKYYVRVRTYKTVDGKLYFSSWSGAKTVTIKK